MKHGVAASLVIWTGLLGITIGFVLLAPPVFLAVRLASSIPWPRLARWCIWAYGRAVAGMLGLAVPVGFTGAHGRVGDPPRIFVFNHASFLDLFLITLAVPPDTICLARQWPFSVPVFGPVMRLGGYINVEKLEGGQALTQAKALLEEGVSLAVFPEGTRSRTGELGRFRSGAFKLSIETGIPVRPVSIEGSGRVLPPKTLLARPGHIRVHVLDDIVPAPYIGEGLGHSAMRRLTRECIRAAGVPAQATS